MKKISFFILFFACLSLAAAHEFWLQPSRYFAKVGDKISVQVLVGEGFDGKRSESKKNRIIQYRHHTTAGITDLTPALQNGTYGDVQIALKTPGTHLFSFANTPKFLSMRADSFLLYLQEDGLDTVIETRKKQGETQKRSRELYQRCVKTLVQVGTPADDLSSRNTGMMLEIIPVKNPYSQHPGQTADFRILFQNKPLAGALVRYWNRDAANRLTEEKQRSDQQGHVRFRLKANRNMVSLVHMIPSDNKAQADWISYWGSLTFGCQ